MDFKGWPTDSPIGFHGRPSIPTFLASRSFEMQWTRKNLPRWASFRSSKTVTVSDMRHADILCSVCFLPGLVQWKTNTEFSGKFSGQKNRSMSKGFLSYLNCLDLSDAQIQWVDVCTGIEPRFVMVEFVPKCVAIIRMTWFEIARKQSMKWRAIFTTPT